MCFLVHHVNVFLSVLMIKANDRDDHYGILSFLLETDIHAITEIPEVCYNLREFVPIQKFTTYRIKGMFKNVFCLFCNIQETFPFYVSLIFYL